MELLLEYLAINWWFSIATLDYQRVDTVYWTKPATHWWNWCMILMCTTETHQNVWEGEFGISALLRGMTRVQYVRANLITIQLVSVLLHLHVGIEYQICRDQQVVPQHAEPLMQYNWGQIKNHEALLEASRIIPLHWAELARLASKLKMYRIGDVFNPKSMLKGITRNNEE